MNESETEIETAKRRRAELCAWFEGSPGCSLLAVESHALRAVWPTLFSRVALQLGCAGPVDLLTDCNAQVRAVLDLPGVSGAPGARVHGAPEALPFDSRSVDLMLLPHTLDFADDPHQVLREVSRVLTPEGHVLILGFNPFSLWGLWRLLRRRGGHAPWCGRFLQLSRIKDWLKLLDFDLARGHMLYYRPPLTSETAMQRLRFLEKAGDRWWPLAGAVYLLVAKKRIAGMTPLRLEWRRTRAFGRAVARPALRVIRGG
jgi:SAM-dependent methyltransferase